MTGIPKSAIQRYTSGETDKIPIDRVILMSEAMGIDPAYVMGWDGHLREKTALALSPDSPAAQKLREIGEALNVSPYLLEISRAMRRMTLEEQKKMVDVGKALFPDYFDNNKGRE